MHHQVLLTDHYFSSSKQISLLPTPATTLSPQIKPEIRRFGDFQSDLCFLPDGWGFRANNKNPMKTSWSLPPTDTRPKLCAKSVFFIRTEHMWAWRRGNSGWSLFLRKFISSCWMLLELSRTAAWIRNSQIYDVRCECGEFDFPHVWWVRNWQKLLAFQLSPVASADGIKVFATLARLLCIKIGCLWQHYHCVMVMIEHGWNKRFPNMFLCCFETFMSNSEQYRNEQYHYIWGIRHCHNNHMSTCHIKATIALVLVVQKLVWRNFSIVLELRPIIFYTTKTWISVTLIWLACSHI